MLSEITLLRLGAPSDSETPRLYKPRWTLISDPDSIRVRFYGRILDQYDQPVIGAKITASYHYSDLFDQLFMHISEGTKFFTSDVSGDFIVKIPEASGICLRIEKVGYQADPITPIGYSFRPNYDYIYGDNPKHPLVYRMWRSQKPVHLCEQSYQMNVRADGTPLTLDLQSGYFMLERTNFTGPTIRVWRDPLFYRDRTAEPKEWRYVLFWPSGKVCANHDIFPYLAPEQGYSNVYQASFLKAETNYSGVDHLSFYFINADHRYGIGKLEVKADCCDEEVFVRLSVRWNPDGTRNLEPAQ